MKVLLLIDIQNDFLPGGALAVKDGHEVVPVANRLMPEYELVVASQDWHPAEHKSFASQHAGRRSGQVVQLNGLDQVLWPDHCVQGTSGAELAPALNRGGIHHVIQKGTDPAIDSYTTDYCVKATALDGLDLGFRVVLLTEGIRGVELKSGDCAQAIAEMRAAGVEIR